MKTKHTEGEWSIHKNVTCCFIEKKHTELDGNEYFQQIAIIKGHDNHAPNYKENEANAKLICKAPEMFAMLSKFQSVLEKQILLTPTGEKRNEMCDLNIEIQSLIVNIIGYDL